MAVDIIEDTVGPMGLWQLGIVVLLFLAKWPINFVTTNIVFIAPKELVPDDYEEARAVYERAINNVDFKTLVWEFNLTGDRAPLMFYCQMAVMLGILFGSYIFGQFADLFGRKHPLLIAAGLIILSKLFQAIMPSIVGIMIVRFISGLGTGGIMIITWVLTMEICGKKYREGLTVIFHCFFLTGYYVSLLFLYLLKSWRQLIFAQTVVACFMIVYICYVPESPRWLIIHGKGEKATKILIAGCKVNKKDTESVEAKVQALVDNANTGTSSSQKRKYTLIDLFRGRRLRFMTIALCSSWVSVGFNYFGLVQYLGQTSDNFYLSTIISTSLQIVSSLITFPIMRFVGRRACLLLSNIICGVAMICCVIVEPGSKISEICIIIGLLGINFTWTACYLYSTELFPTVVRSVGCGLASTFSRVGSLLTPLVLMTQQYNGRLPFVIYAIVAITTAIAVYQLPETLNTVLPESLEDAEKFGL